MDRDFKGIWISKEIWLNPELSAVDKVLLAEIDSLDNEQHCYATNEYFAEFLQVSVPTISRSIKKLTELGLIKTKTEKTSTGSQRIIKVIRGGSNQNDEGGLIKTISNKYNKNNKDNIISKDIIQEEPDKPKKKSLFEKCQDKTREIFQDEKLITALDDYLPIRLAIKDKPIYGVNQWAALLNRLKDMSGDLIVIVNASIERGWASFYQSANQNVNHQLTSTPNSRIKFGEDSFVNNNRSVDGGDSSGVSF